VDVEPLRVLDLIGLGHDIATGVLGMEAQHHRMGKRPALTAHVLDIADFQLHFFVNFADQAVFGRLTRLGKPRQRAVDPGTKRGDRASRISSPRVTSTIMLGEMRG